MRKWAEVGDDVAVRSAQQGPRAGRNPTPWVTDATCQELGAIAD